jgi:hypothetical protein
MSGRGWSCRGKKIESPQAEPRRRDGAEIGREEFLTAEDAEDTEETGKLAINNEQ